MRNNDHTYRNKLVNRSKQGSVIVSFAAELAVGTMVIIAFAFFLLDAVVSSLYREKLACITAHGAVFAANYSGTDLQGATRTYVSELCNQMGLPVINPNIQTADTTVNGKAAASCSVSSAFPLLKGSILPNTINLSDTSVALVPKNTPGTAAVNIMGNANNVDITAPSRLVQIP